ncbi:MAG TPA: DUF523 domain-containing protein, partial [Geobacterales bacterium]|nr:DUF523 domain-containing protein [Geobacterales bacterium]
MVQQKIRIGVSSCLLGERVRYNGGHKLDQLITGTLAGFFELVPVCPEVECGLPVPREPMHLVGDPARPRLVTVQSGVDLTEQMETYSQRRVAELAAESLSGFVFKKGSPSSGLHGVKVHGEGKRWRSGRGLFAAAVVKGFPLLPVEEEERLANPRLRENFLERVLVYHHWQELLAG